MTDDFAEIAHSGGKVTFRFKTDDAGRRSYQIGYSHSRPVASVLTAVYALPPGVVVGTCKMGGIGDPWSPPPVAGCFPVLIASDSEGKFGHNCPSCKAYWRSGPWPKVCPYCGIESEPFQFLSAAQQKFVEHYLEKLLTGLDAIDDGEVEIDMDKVADATGKDVEKPEFYISDERQQKKFKCTACNEFNDILGIYGYCSSCGTRNDLAIFENEKVPALRSQANSSGRPEESVPDAVSAFDSLTGQYVRQLAKVVPISRRRKARLERQRFHNIREVAGVLANWFDIDIFSGIAEDDVDFIERMFHRRHVYEHNGGEVDQKYLDDSGDQTVRLKQHIHETQEDVNRLISLLVKMAKNLNQGFHELIPPLEEPIQAFEKEKERLKAHGLKPR